MEEQTRLKAEAAKAKEDEEKRLNNYNPPIFQTKQEPSVEGQAIYGHQLSDAPDRKDKSAGDGRSELDKQADTLGKQIFSFTLLFVAACLYFLPSFLAYQHKHRNLAALVVLNLLLGRTFVGWVVALVWALIREQQRA